MREEDVSRSHRNHFSTRLETMAPLHTKRVAMMFLLPESACCAIFLAQERSRQISASFQACGFIMRPRPRPSQTYGVDVIKRRTISMWSMHASNMPIPHEDVMERIKTSLGGGWSRTTSQEPTDGRQSQGQGSDGAREKPPATAYHDPPRQSCRKTSSNCTNWHPQQGHR